MADRRILITGGSGRLGSAICSVIECFAPGRTELDVTNLFNCADTISRYDPDSIIHCAGYVHSLKAEIHQRDCWELNVEGSENMVRAAMGRHFVYISTDYVFDGQRGNYSEGDIPNPVNFYGLSKLAGEMVVSQHPNTLILRAPFRDDPPWKYDRAFADQWTSCDFVSVRAPEIVQVALMGLTGVLHIGGARRSILELARSAGRPGIGPLWRHQQEGIILPRDVSLNSEEWRGKADRYPVSS